MADNKKSIHETMNPNATTCRWLTRSGPKDCDMPNPVVIDGVEMVILPVGTKLYHATLILGKERKWFEETRLTDSERQSMWFASTPDHAKQMNWTHLLEYTTREELKLMFIRNIWIHSKKTTGRNYLSSRTYKQNLTTYRKHGLDGYAGCNECEYMIFDRSFKKLEEGPIVLEERPVASMDGGRAKTRNRVVNGDNCRRLKSLVPQPALKHDSIHGSPTAKAVGDGHNLSSFSSLTRKSARKHRRRRNKSRRRR
jgi:hypothetical protein